MEMLHASGPLDLNQWRTIWRSLAVSVLGQGSPRIDASVPRYRTPTADQICRMGTDKSLPQRPSNPEAGVVSKVDR